MYKKIRRRQADGTFVVIEVPATYQLQEGEELARADEPVTPTANPNQSVQPGDVLTPQRVQEMIAQARTEERTRLTQVTQELEQERTARTTLEQRLQALEEQRRQAELNGMAPDARREAELNQQLQAFRQAQQQSTQEIQSLRAHLRATELAAYRERALRAYGDAVLPELVMGSNEAEIDAAAARAAQVYAGMRQRLEADIAARYGIQPGQPPVVNPGVPTVTIPNQTYVPQMVQDGTSGFPTAVQPNVPNEATTPTMDLSQVTTEEAVRAGQWGGELRAQVLNNLRAGGSPGVGANLGTAPRFMGGMAGYQTIPGVPGVQAPVAAPIPPAAGSPQVAGSRFVQPAPGQAHAPAQVPGNFPQYPGQQQTPPGGDAAARAAAQAALQRTYAGQNPVVNNDPTARAILQANQHQGGNAAQTYAARFAPSAPLNSQPGQSN